MKLATQMKNTIAVSASEEESGVVPRVLKMYAEHIHAGYRIHENDDDYSLLYHFKDGSIAVVVIFRDGDKARIAYNNFDDYEDLIESAAHIMQNGAVHIPHPSVRTAYRSIMTTMLEAALEQAVRQMTEGDINDRD